MADVINGNYENYNFIDTLETGKMTSKDSVWGNSAAAGAMIAGGALAGLLGVTATLADQERQHDVVMHNIAAESDALAMNLNNQERLLKDIDNTLGMALTYDGLETMKLESNAKARGAESGSTTMSSDLAADELMASTFRQSEIVREGKMATSNAMSDIQTSIFNSNQRIEQMVFNQPSPLQAGLQTLGAFTNTASQGMSLALDLELISRASRKGA